ncbi:hypothetical protein [Kitasatospora sp. NPDC057015]|uniref:hypothetical protein n=1 Tax=Kitasatospora sp. NPDC057015 TaxID=3346001 RepID=UPI003624DF1D
MSTTRHLINRRRRVNAVRDRAGGPPAPAGAAPGAVAVGGPGLRPPVGAGAGLRRSALLTGLVRRRPGPDAEGAAATGLPADPGGSVAVRPRRRRWLAPAVLALLTVLLGGFAAVARGEASALRASPGVHNAALADAARTNEVKGAVSQAVNALFSYSYADPARSEDAAKRLLVGAAVQQYAGMLAEVRARGPQQKLVLTTTVTGGGVVLIEGDRARVLVFADQRSTSTAQSAAAGDGTFAAAMFAVDAVRQGGVWRIAGIDTFDR